VSDVPGGSPTAVGSPCDGLRRSRRWREAALFLARSKYTTGEVLTVDGGFQLM
jgi:NAD(P)-dependent dehydrogenase (short-subunit alcohol dehydrogenase family)